MSPIAEAVLELCAAAPQIRCDADRCTAALTLPHDVDAVRADVIARCEGWLVRVGMQRSYHWCEKHRQGEM